MVHENHRHGDSLAKTPRPPHLPAACGAHRAGVTVMLLTALVALATLLAMVQEFGVAQKIVSARAAGGNLRLWHSLGSVLVLGQWLCAAAVLWRLVDAPRSIAPA